MPSKELRIIPIEGIPAVQPGDDVAALILSALMETGLRLQNGDILVVAQKIVSKAEGRVVHLESITPSDFAKRWAADYDKDPRLVEVVLSESRRIVRMDHGVLITETHHGFICANSGVDASNVESGTVTLLPLNADASAVRIRTKVREETDADVGVIVSDTFGRPWREGLVNVALGVAGVPAVEDLRGKSDWKGETLRVTVIATADELASAAELVMGKADGIPAVIIRGLNYEPSDQTGRELIRNPELDMFR